MKVTKRTEKKQGKEYNSFHIRLTPDVVEKSEIDPENDIFIWSVEERGGRKVPQIIWL